MTDVKDIEAKKLLFETRPVLQVQDYMVNAPSCIEGECITEFLSYEKDVEKQVAELGPDSNYLGFCLTLTMKDLGINPDAISVFVDYAQFINDEDDFSYTFNAIENVIPSAKTKDNDLIVSFQFVVKPDTYDDDYEIFEKLISGKTFLANIAIVAANKFAKEEFLLTGNVVFDNKFHDAAALEKSNVSYDFLPPGCETR